MARLACGGSAADFAVAFDVDGNAIRQPGAEATFWDALTSGNQYGAAPDPDDGTGLIDGAGSPISSVILDSDGFVPGNAVYTPDGVTRLAIDAAGGSGPRRWIYPNDPVALSIAAQTLAAQAQATANAALTASGGGGTGTVSKVADVPPDATGNVPLTAGAIGALAAKAGNAVSLAINDQFLRVDIDDEDNTSSPNRVEYAFQGDLTFYQNEYGELRVIAARGSTTPIRAIANAAGQTGDLFQACDNDRNPLGGFRANGQVYGPNVGNARTSKGTTAPLAPALGDVWIDTSQNPPVLKVYDGSIWVVPSGGGGGTAPDAAPAFQAATNQQTGGTSHTATKPSAGATLVAVLAWNGTGAATAPDGWTLVDELTTTASRAGVWIADAAVSSLTWTFGSSLNVSSVILGYDACSVLAHAGLSDTSGDAVHTAPDLTVGTVPATVLRAWFDKISVTAGSPQTPTLPAGVTQRALEAPSGGSLCTVLAADAEQDTAGAAGTVDATYDLTAGNAGAFTIALVAAA